MHSEYAINTCMQHFGKRKISLLQKKFLYFYIGSWSSNYANYVYVR